MIREKRLQRFRKSSACKVNGEKYYKNMILLKNAVRKVRQVVRDETKESKTPKSRIISCGWGDE